MAAAIIFKKSPGTKGMIANHRISLRPISVRRAMKTAPAKYGMMAPPTANEAIETQYVGFLEVNCPTTQAPGTNPQINPPVGPKRTGQPAPPAKTGSPIEPPRR